MSFFNNFPIIYNTIFIILFQFVGWRTKDIRSVRIGNEAENFQIVEEGINTQ